MQNISNYRNRPSALRETAKTLIPRSLYVIMKSQLAGNMAFDGHTPSAEERKNSEDSRMLCGKIERQLQSCKVNEIPMLISCYDILFMIGNRRMPDRNAFDFYKKRVIDAWKRGDKTIEESEVFGLIATEATFHPDTASAEYVKIYKSIKNRWLDTLFKFNRFPEVMTKENYERLALIMRDDLEISFGADSAKMKQRWYEANKVNDLTGLTTSILRSYHRFVTALYPEVLSYDEKLSLEPSILKELTSRTDLDHYTRESYRLSHAFTNAQTNS